VADPETLRRRTEDGTITEANLETAGELGILGAAGEIGAVLADDPTADDLSLADARRIAANIAAKQEFAGYWEYVLDEAIYTVPAHPNWGGTAVINDRGHLIGLGSLHIEESEGAGNRGHLNMIVPIDLLKPILDDLVTIGYTKAAIAKALGAQTPALQVYGRITAGRMARLVEVHRLLVATHEVHHGTLSGHREHGCRCIACRRWAADQAAFYRARRVA
jgi:hypothetical protein